MPNNYLLVVEWANDEKNILHSAFEKYGFNVIKCEEKISVASYSVSNDIKKSCIRFRGPSMITTLSLSDFNSYL